MKKSYRKIIGRRKGKIQRRLDRNRKAIDSGRPVLSSKGIVYEMSDRIQATPAGGIGVVHRMVERIGLNREIDEKVEVLKFHFPYHESDHVLNLTYNIMSGGSRLEDIELRRQDAAWLDGLNAERIPDPTTAGDFTRRFGESDILDLQEAINQSRLKVWREQPEGFLEEAFIDVDGTMAETGAECAAGVDISYKGIWGYAPLIVSLSNTKEVLYICNRPGNKPSHIDSVPWIDRAIELVGQRAGHITLRGDTDFTHTAHLDRWDAGGTGFIFGIDAHRTLVELAEDLDEEDWSPLERLPKYEIRTRPRRKPRRHKEEVIIRRGFENIELAGESIAEIDYRPAKCKQSYRVIILRKDLTTRSGEKALFHHVRYFFYITNRRDLDADMVIALANQRCDQENVIEQLKNGVNAMRVPVHDLESNWAYMVMAALAWNLKAWMGLLLPDSVRGDEVIGMEFRRFLHALILIPCQVLRSGRRLVYRILSYNQWLRELFALAERLDRPLRT